MSWVLAMMTDGDDSIWYGKDWSTEAEAQAFLEGAALGLGLSAVEFEVRVRGNEVIWHYPGSLDKRLGRVP